MSEPGKENASVNDLGSWLISVGAPESISDLIPSEMARLDIGPLLALFNGIGLNGSGLMGSELGGVSVKSGLLAGAGGNVSADEIRWLPIIRS
ncbi:MAG: hypothetical protein OSA11_07380 [Candidatus Nanopelagicales bacterium]|nr:hypothetical protein [Candidatus Nanopelagicales bacterium]